MSSPFRTISERTRFSLRFLVLAQLASGLVLANATPPESLSARYDARPAGTGTPAAPAWQVENPAQNLRVFISTSRVRLVPLQAALPVWSLDLTPQGFGTEGSPRPDDGTTFTALKNRVDYHVGGRATWFTNDPAGLQHGFRLTAPPDASAGPAAHLDLAIGGDLAAVPAAGGRTVEFVTDDGQAILRYGQVHALSASGAALPVRLDVTGGLPASARAALRISVEAAATDYPLTIEAVLESARPRPALSPDGLPLAPAGAAQTVGVRWRGQPGVVETIAQLMEREARTPPSTLMQIKEHPPRSEWPRGDNLASPLLVQWPPAETSAPSSALVEPLSPQTLGTSFRTVSLSEAPFIPPDSVGDIGPTQILAATNGRIKVFNRAGVLGGLNVSLDTFFTSVRAGSGTSDPQVRYDRLSGRWFVSCINVSTPNRIMIAVSSGSIITSAASFTFFGFQHDLVSPAGDTGDFADYDSLGVDRFALYIGTNTFNALGNTYLGATGFVINKADLITGTLTVTAFRGLNGGCNPTTGVCAPGPHSPRGVTNDDPAATEGYFIGPDNAVFGLLVLRRISNPGGTPSISGNLNVSVPATTFPAIVPHLGMRSGWYLDPLDDRLFAARINKNKLTGALSLWTAHNIEVDTSGVAATGGGRDGSRWYEITNLSTTPTLNQSGTLFDPTASSPRFFWIPTVAMSGQGHMALGSSTAGTLFHADAAAAGRLAGDALGTIQPYSALTSSTTAYNVAVSPTPSPTNPQRWGDYSYVGVDPLDDMTMWTFQEYCDNTNSWGVRAVQLIAPPPATPVSASPSVVCQGTPSISVTINGTSGSGSGFFDPGPDTGGPGFPNHIGAAVTGGVTVNSVTFNSTNQVTLDLSTAAAIAGAVDVTVTNPDTQAKTGTGILSIISGTATAPVAGNDGPICAGATLHLTASTVPGAIYSWSGPNGFTSNQQNPSIPGATAAAAGTYSVTATVCGATSSPATTSVTVTGDGGACNDGNACTQTDTCQASVCAGANPVTCTPLDQCHAAGVCDSVTGVCSNPTKTDGTACNDGNACTQTDTCQAGVCAGSNPVICTALDQCHDPGVCDTATGVCSNPTKTDGTACSDGNACTQTDTCQAGVCAGANPVTCAALDQCHDPGVCDTATGVCSNPAKADGTLCSDGNVCTTADSCQAGVCLGGPPPDLDGDGHIDAACGGTDCNDSNPLVWAAPGEVSGLMFVTDVPAAMTWDSQSVLSGPETSYDLVSGVISSSGSIDFSASTCLQTAGPAAYTDTRPDPAIDSLYWYLARGQNSCGVGTYGTVGRDTTMAPCP
jgi:hypothetical protein